MEQVYYALTETLIPWVEDRFGRVAAWVAAAALIADDRGDCRHRAVADTRLTILICLSATAELRTFMSREILGS
jgi:hypothetical protein